MVEVIATAQPDAPDVAAVGALPAESEALDLVLVIVLVRVTFLVTVDSTSLVVVSPYPVGVVAAALLLSPRSVVGAAAGVSTGAWETFLVKVFVKVFVSLMVKVLIT